MIRMITKEDVKQLPIEAKAKVFDMIIDSMPADIFKNLNVVITKVEKHE
jgi:hypothetical protein